jgi:ribokinase
MRDFLAGENIGHLRNSYCRHSANGIALITVDSASENSIVVSGANMVWHKRDLTRMKIEPADIVISQFEIPPAIIESVFERAKEIGATTILNPAPIKPATEKILRNVDYLVVNELELEASSGATVNPDDSTSVYVAMEHLTSIAAAIVATLGRERFSAARLEDTKPRVTR